MVRRRAGPLDAVVPYGPLAEAYDIVHARKPYAREAGAVRALARRHAHRPLRSLLDVACGSGRHLEAFSRWFDCAGVDASAAMLARARTRVPSADLHLGRMETFDLGREFDVVTCLFSAIGYVRSVRELRRTLRNFARHTAPGGVVVVEPWLTPGAFREGSVHHLTAVHQGTAVLRANSSERRRGRSVMEFHYLLGRPGSVEHFVETHDCGLFDVRTMKAAFRSAGLLVRYLPQGLESGRGLYVARRPELGDVGRMRTLRARRSRRREGR